MLSKNEPFNHEIYEQLTQKNFKSKDKKLNINNAIKFLSLKATKFVNYLLKLFGF